ncbi:MAG TPA: hypothetical protein P5556_05415 [Candidatus Gastranaerophilales bacterium]|nr:hypothetical protein [Candidatus Gastranaerophilales bacterium]
MKIEDEKKSLFTNFSGLLNTVISVKHETEVISQIYKLKTTGIYTNLKDIAITHSGIYTVLSEGVIKKVALYPAKTQSDKEHKYHIFLCDSLKNYLLNHNENNLNSFKVNRRKDRKFNVKLAGKYQNTSYQDKKLNICIFCLSRLNALIGGDSDIKAENFDLTDFLTNDNYFESPQFFTYDYDLLPGFYEKSWDSVATTAKIKYNFVCQKCFIDLKEKYFQKYLHVHYVEKQMRGKRIDIIKPLCIRCHSEEEGHNDIKKLPVYGEFTTILESRKNR